MTEIRSISSVEALEQVRGTRVLGWVGMLLTRLVVVMLIGVAGAVGRVEAHVGNPYVVFEGKAGGYPLRAVVKQPDVVPGLAEINVRILEGSPDRVLVLPLHSATDRGGAPRADVARRVEGDTNLYQAELWFMARGAYGVEIQVEGSRGGTFIVPVNSLASARKPMPEWLGGVLMGLGLVLAAGVVMIAAAAVREATLDVGEERILESRRGAAWIAGGVALCVVIGALYWGNRWWGYEEGVHASRVVFKPFDHRLEQIQSNGIAYLDLRLTDRRATNRSYALLPDHGKWVHLFLMGQGHEPAFVHLHPVKLDSTLFRSALPPLPPGRYALFAELAHEVGVTQTLTNEVEISAPITTQPAWSDPADSWRASASVADGIATLSEGQVMSLKVEHGVTRGEPSILRVEVRDTTGKPVRLEPYLRMLGHAVVMREDRGVFAHLHPAGTLSMAAARKLARKMNGEEAARQSEVVCGDFEALPPEVASAFGTGGEVEFPFVFPGDGSYFVWVQVRAGGKIETGCFRVSHLITSKSGAGSGS